MPNPLVIGHRGACGYVPEHTLASYFVAIESGADYIEPDLVMTRDGVLVARHENEIGGTTDVAAHAEFADRYATKSIDGSVVSGWFTEDFTLAELKTLRARERIPLVRPDNTRFDGQFEIPTFEEILAVLAGVEARRQAAASRLGQPPPIRIGVYPETKHPTYFAGLGLPMEAALVSSLHRHGFAGPNGRAFIQCFEVSNLKAMRAMTQLPLVQLIEAEGAPYDLTLKGDARIYADLITPVGLAEVATYANAIGPSKSLVIPRTAHDTLGAATALIDDAHAHGLAVHAWTFRAEAQYVPKNVPGGMIEEILAFLRVGLDGFFTDHANIGAQACREFLAQR